MSSLLTPDDPAYPGQAHYTRSFLRIYDPLVLGFFGKVVWRCPTQRLIDHYSQFIGERHLDVGPGTGYFLEAAPMGAAITLLDPNPDVLAHCAARLSDMQPTLVQGDVTQTLPIDGPFDSVALNYVIHCLPSSSDHKSAAVANAASVLTEDGVLFGATVLGTPSLHTWLSARALKANNRRGIFDNLADDAEMLSALLDRHFMQHTIEVVGSVAVFSAHLPKTA